MSQNYLYPNAAYPAANGLNGQPPVRGRSPLPAQAATPPNANMLSPPSTPQMQPGVPGPNSRSASPAIDSTARRTKRHYPTYAVADQSVMQQPSFSPAPTAPSPQQQFRSSPAPYTTPTPATPIQNNYNNAYAGLVNGVADMNLYSKPLPPTREDVSLVGQPPLIADLDNAPPVPQTAQNITATSSPFAQTRPSMKRSTLNAIPASNSLLKKSKLPLSLVIEPYPWPDEDVPVVTDTIVARCTRCKTYINPFVQFTQGALKWTCNMCGLGNDVPAGFDYDPTSQQPVDRWTRPELNYGCVDFVASAEYMVRPPQPPAFVFVIDTSFRALESGMIPIIVNSIMESLDNIPNEDGRTKVAIITVDNAVGFYKLVGDEPEMLVVGDLSDIYLPRAAGDLLVDLADAKTLLQDLLERMKTMYNETHAVNNCLGVAMQAAKKLLSSTGGKIMCFQASLPNVGEGAVKATEESKKPILDSAIMTPSSTFYRTFASECVKAQVCADMFILGGQLADVSTLNVIPRFTGGQTYFYPRFNANNMGDAQRLREEIKLLLSEPVGLEAVMRTRCSPGLVCQAFHGNCTTRVPDIMALPNVPRNHSYCVDLGIEEDIQASHVFFQTALLYTTSFGERRIRVMNLCLPVVKTVADLFASADQVAIARALCHQAIDRAVTNKLKDAREFLAKQTAEISAAYGREVMGSVASGAARLTLGRNLALLPLLVLGILKTETFNEAPVIPMDIRASSTILLRTLRTDDWKNLVVPRFFSLHNMSQMAGAVDPNTGKMVLPPRLPLSSEKLERHGCFLLDDGQRIYLWIGKEAVPQLCMDLLGVPNIAQVQSGQVPELLTLKNTFSQRVSAIIQHLRTSRSSTYYPTLFIVKEDGDPVLQSMFLSRLLEDRLAHGPATAGANQDQVSSGMSYFQWLGFLRAKCQ